MVQQIPLDLTDDVSYKIKLQYISTKIDGEYEYLYLSGMTPGNLSLDDHINVSLYENANNLTTGYEVIYNAKQYLNANGQKTDEPTLAFDTHLTSRNLNSDVTDINQLGYTTYIKLNRGLYLALKRKIDNNTEQMSMKYTSFGGLITASNVHVATKITLTFHYRPVSISPA
jgi:hypothetical protein